MVAAVWYAWVAAGALVLLCLASASGAQCVVPTASNTYFSNDLEDMNDRICHKCYQAPYTHQLEVKLLKVHLLGLSSIMLYINGIQRHITQDCGFCDTPGNQTVSDLGSGETACRECEAIPSGQIFELYLRLDSKSHVPEVDNACQKIAEFNISLTFVEKLEVEAPLDCDDGFMVSFPAGGDTCIVNITSLALETSCIVPTCSEGIISPDQLTEKVEHMFHPSSPSESCVWQLNTGGRKHLTLRFSRGIRPHLTVFEESLDNPKWDMEWCPAYRDVFRRDTDADTVFVVYRNPSKLAKQGSLSITTQPDLCLLPPTLEDGSVEFQRQGSGTVARYTCGPGYTLLGPPQLNCTHGTWMEPPVCTLDKPAAEDDELAEETKEEGKEGTKVEKVEPLEREVAEEDKDEDEVWEERAHVNTSLHDWSLGPDINATTNGTNPDDEGSKGFVQMLLDTLDIEEDLVIYVIGGGAGLLLLLVIILAVTVAMCRNSYSGRLGLGRRFDTFQNPIYEKTVVRVPIQSEREGGGGHGEDEEEDEDEEEEEEDRKKSDAEEMSDCTVLE